MRAIGGAEKADPLDQPATGTAHQDVGRLYARRPERGLRHRPDDDPRTMVGGGASVGVVSQVFEVGIAAALVTYAWRLQLLFTGM